MHSNLAQGVGPVAIGKYLNPEERVASILHKSRIVLSPVGAEYFLLRDNRSDSSTKPGEPTGRPHIKLDLNHHPISNDL